MNKWISVLMIIVIILSAGACSIIDKDLNALMEGIGIYDEHIAPTEGIRTYNEDYIKKYEDTFNVMFDNNWKVIAKEDKYKEYEEICPHVDTRPQQYTQWTIEYYDGSKNNQTFTFDNRGSLSDQIQEYIRNYIADYYKENFYDVRMKDIPLASSSYVFGFLTKMTANRDDKENRHRTKKSDEFLERLETPQGAICLSKLTPANSFEMCPVYLTIRISFSEFKGDKIKFEESAQKEVEKMIADMNEFTGYHLNASIIMKYSENTYLENGERSLRWHYVQGEKVDGIDSSYFERYVFDGYKGIFW